MNKTKLILLLLVLVSCAITVYYFNTGTSSEKSIPINSSDVSAERISIESKSEKSEEVIEPDSPDLEVKGDINNKEMANTDKNEIDADIEQASQELLTINGALDIDVVQKLFNNRSKFEDMQDRFSELYPDSEHAFENKIKYQELFLSTKEQYSSEVNLNRIECSSEQCLASIYVNSLNEIKDYVGNLRRSETHPMNSLIVGQSKNELLLVFTTTQDAGSISLSKK